MKTMPGLLATVVLACAPLSARADIFGRAYLNSPASTSAVIGFAHGAPDVTFSVPSPGNAACTGLFAGDTLCFQSDESSFDTLAQFLATGGATILSGSDAALGSKLNNTGFEFTGYVTVTNGMPFDAGHDDGMTLMIGTSVVIDAPTPTGFETTPSIYNGPSGTYAFDLVYGECCAGPADLGIALPLASIDSVPLPEPTTLALLGSGLVGIVTLRRRALSPR